MKLFLQKIIVFISLILLMSGIVFFLNYSLVSSTKFSFELDKEIVVLGDSNSKNAINDSIFNDSFNFSGPADSYFYSYLKLNKILEDNSNSFNTVFLSFSPHNIIDNGWVFNEEDMITRFPQYYPLMSKDDLIFLFNNKHDVFFSSLGRVFRDLPNIIQSKIKGSIISNYGGFEFADRNNLNLALEKLAKDEPIPHFNLPGNFKISLQETLYLKKIINLCKNKKLNLFLVNTPKRKELLIHKRYFVAEFNQFYDKELKNVPYLDFSNVIMPDEYYNDLVHLNYKGASYFSNLLKNQELKKLLETYQRNYIR